MGDREESERLARNVRKKLQQIETLEGLENERGAGALDAQRENNRLTGETNGLLRESNKHLSKLRNRGSVTASFG